MKQIVYNWKSWLDMPSSVTQQLKWLLDKIDKINALKLLPMFEIVCLIIF